MPLFERDGKFRAYVSPSGETGPRINTTPRYLEIKRGYFNLPTGYDRLFEILLPNGQVASMITPHERSGIEEKRHAFYDVWKTATLEIMEELQQYLEVTQGRLRRGVLKRTRYQPITVDLSGVSPASIHSMTTRYILDFITGIGRPEREEQRPRRRDDSDNGPSGSATSPRDIERAIRANVGLKETVSEKKLANIVGIAPEVRQRAEDYVDRINDFFNPQSIYHKRGIGLPQGFIIFGPVGTGKTALVDAIAGEVGKDKAILIRQNIAGVRSMWVGQSESNVQSMISNLIRKAKEAEKKKKVVIFTMDEIDALFPSRKEETPGSHHDKTFVSAFIQELDRLQRNTNNVIILGTTNLVDRLDDAPVSRLESPIYMGLPDDIQRLDLFIYYLSNRTAKAQKGIEIFQPDLQQALQAYQLAKRNNDQDKINVARGQLEQILSSVIAHSAGFAGRDIEKVVDDSVSMSTRRARRGVSTEDGLTQVSDIMAATRERELSGHIPEAREILRRQQRSNWGSGSGVV